MLSNKKVIEVIQVIKYLSLITTVTLITLVTASGQANINSPYSRYGIGDLQFSGFARDMGMGGLGIAVSSPYNLNFANPASYASLSLTTFEAGIRGNSTWLNSSGVSENSTGGSFGYFGFGFPIKARKWGLAFGLMPFTSVGYNISEVQNTDDAGNVTYTYKGKGGINRFFVGTGYSLARNLRLGVNASYLFGTINQTRTVDLPDITSYFSTRITDETTVGDFHFNFGLQYTLDSLRISHSDSIMNIRRRMVMINKEIDAKKDSISAYEKRLSHSADSTILKTNILLLRDSIATLNKQMDAQEDLKKHVVTRRAAKDWSLNFGATLSLTSNISATRTSLTELYISQGGFVYIKDTAQNIGDNKGAIRLPLMAGFGFTMRKGGKWLFGADVSTQDWTTYRSFGATDSLVSSVQFKGGIQYTPDETSIRSYKKVIQYRLGFHYTQTFLKLNNTGINDYGASIGFGLPMRKTLSVIQFAFEYGRMGTLVNQLVEVNYFRFTLGLTLNDVWFLKPRID